MVLAVSLVLLKGDGMIDSPGLHVFPSSLYEAQLAARLGSRYKECHDVQESALALSSSSSKATQQKAGDATTVGATPSSASLSPVLPVVGTPDGTGGGMVFGGNDVVVVVPLLSALFVVVVFAVAFAVAFWVHRRRRCKTASAGRRKEVNEDAWKSTVDVDTGEEYCFKEGRTTWTRPGRSLVGERVLGKLNW